MREDGQSRGPAPFTQLADDVVALSEALGLDRPAVCGFSEGGITATIAAIRHPGSLRAIVNHAGYDFFNPQAPSFAMMRLTLGGSPEATRADPEAAERFFASDEEMRATFVLMQSDQDGAQGVGHWRQYLAGAFDRCTQSPGYTFDDLARIAAPTLILTGDRDHFCSVEEGVTAYRALQAAELAVLPNHGHYLTPAAVDTTIDFLMRHSAFAVTPNGGPAI